MVCKHCVSAASLDLEFCSHSMNTHTHKNIYMSNPSNPVHFLKAAAFSLLETAEHSKRLRGLKCITRWLVHVKELERAECIHKMKSKKINRNFSLLFSPSRKKENRTLNSTQGKMLRLDEIAAAESNL